MYAMWRMRMKCFIIHQLHIISLINKTSVRLVEHTNKLNLIQL